MKISRSKSKVESKSDIDHLTNLSDKSKQEASKHVKAAINCLISCSKDDTKAKEAIANLSVVHLQLK